LPGLLFLIQTVLVEEVHQGSHGRRAQLQLALAYFVKRIFARVVVIKVTL
jgi:hypothetical protein